MAKVQTASFAGVTGIHGGRVTRGCMVRSVVVLWEISVLGAPHFFVYLFVVFAFLDQSETEQQINATRNIELSLW